MPVFLCVRMRVGGFFTEQTPARIINHKPAMTSGKIISQYFPKHALKWF
jgi:GT2 family glycosyltransferase